jgi:hypothetical protein
VNKRLRFSVNGGFHANRTPPWSAEPSILKYDDRVSEEEFNETLFL